MLGRLFGSTINILEKGLDLRARRQAILASNIANAETPGFQAKDLDFKRLIQKFAQDQLGEGYRHQDAEGTGRPVITSAGDQNSLPLVTTDPRHFPSGTTQEELEAQGIVVSKETGVPNGVDLDIEMSKLAENSVQYQATLQLLTKKFNGLKNVITEGGKV